MKKVKTWFVNMMIACAVAQAAHASDLDEAPNRISFECSSPEIGRIEADLDLDFGYYYHGMAVHFDTKGNFLGAFVIRQDDPRNPGAVYGDGRIWLSVPHTGEPDWRAHDAECVAPVVHPGATISISLENPTNSRIELIEGSAWNPRVGMVYKQNESPWPTVLYVLDGKVCEEGPTTGADLPLTCTVR